MDGGVKLVKAAERHSLDIGIDGFVKQFHGILHQGLVLGVPDTCRIYRTSVMLGKCGEHFIDHRLVAVASAYGRLEIVRHYRGRNAAEVLHGALTSFDEVFLALGPYGLTVSVMTERQYRDEHLCFFSLARHAVDHLKAVSGKVDVHLVSGIMLHMSDHLALMQVLTESLLEHRQSIAVRISSMIPLVQPCLGHTLACQLFCILGKKCFKLRLTL